MKTKEIISKLAAISNSFTPQYLDLLTYNIILYANERLLKEICKKVRFEEIKGLKKELPTTIYKLLVESYLLGRIERGNEKKTIHYSKVADSADLFYEKNQDAVIGFNAVIKSIFDDGFFTQPSDEIKEAIKALEEIYGNDLVNIIEYNDENNKNLGRFLLRSIHIGREIALMEQLFYDKKLVEYQNRAVDKKVEEMVKEFKKKIKNYQ